MSVHWSRLTDPLRFREQAFLYLLSSEVENTLVIANTLRLCDKPGFYKDTQFWIGRDGAQDIKGVAWCMPPHPLGFSRLSPAAMDSLISALQHQQYATSGCIGPKESVALFIERWLNHHQISDVSLMSQRIWKLDKVILPLAPQGSMRSARPSEFPVLLDWSDAFMVECGIPSTRSEVQKILQASQDRLGRYVWETDRGIVSMADISGFTPSGSRIGWVYTPPLERGQGYAGRLVAELSQAQLDLGYKFCSLYTDLANPISNRIYEKMGYRPVCDASMATFAAGPMRR